MMMMIGHAAAAKSNQKLSSHERTISNTISSYWMCPKLIKLFSSLPLDHLVWYYVTHTGLLPHADV